MTRWLCATNATAGSILLWLLIPLFDEAMKSYGHADDAQGSVVYDGGDFCAVRRAMAAKGSLVTTGEVVNFFYLTRKFSAKNRRCPKKVGARGRRSGAKRRRVSR